MDDPALDSELHSGALRGLDRIATFGRTDANVWRALDPLFRRGARSLADLGCGSGRLLRLVRFRTRNEVSLTGVDLSPHCLMAAHRNLPGATFLRADLTATCAAALASARSDIVVSSVFLHHLSRPDAVHVLRLMGQLAHKRVVVLDIERSWLSWWVVHATARVVTRSPVVHIDAGLSVAAGWKADELEELALEAGLREVRVHSVFPFQLLLIAKPIHLANKTAKDSQI